MDTRNEFTVITDNEPVIERQGQDYKPGFLSKKLLYSIMKYGTWLLLSLAILFTGLGTKLSDLARERGYWGNNPSEALIWGGFAVAIYLIYSAITFYFDWKLENDIAPSFGIHSMPPINVIGKWLRKTLIDTFGFFFISMLLLTSYFIPVIYQNLYPGFKPSINPSPSWWIWTAIVSIVLIPLYFPIRRALNLLLGNFITRISTSYNRQNNVPLIILGILNIISNFFMWRAFSYLGMFSDKESGVAFTFFIILITGTWAVFTILSIFGRFVNRQSQIQVVYLIGTSLLTVWYYLYKMGTFNIDYMHWRFVFFPIAALLITFMLIELVSIFKVTGMDETRLGAIQNISKKFSIIPLGFHYYGLQGDGQVETKLFGLFGLFYVFIPENLENEEEIYASVTHAFARYKNNNGLVLAIARILLFTVLAIFAWLLFDYSYMSGMFSWFYSFLSGDSQLILVLLMAMGFIFGIAGKPLINKIAMAMDKYSRKTVATFVKPEVYESYITKLEQATGEYGNTDKIAQLYFADSHQAD
jgi:hypothetical protein